MHSGVEGLAHAALAQPAPGLVGQAGAVGAAVVQDGNLAAWPPLGQEVAGDLALAVVAADQPEDVAAALLGQPRVAGGGRQHRYAGRLVNRGRHQRGMRAEMADHEADAGIDQRLRGRVGLFDAAGIVCSNHPNGLAEQPPVPVQLFDRDLDRGSVAGSGRSIRSGKRVGEADPDLRHGRFGGAKHGCDGEHETEMPTHGARLPSATDHRDPIRANIGKYNVTSGGIRLQAAMMPDVGTAAIGRRTSGTSGGRRRLMSPELAAGRPCSRGARRGVSAHHVIRLSRARLKHAAATRQLSSRRSCLSVPSRKRADYIRGWKSGEVGSIVIATAISYKPLQEVLRDRGISACELLEALPAAVYLTDAGGHLTFYNRAAADLWGWRPDLRSARWCGSWRLFWPDGTPLPHDQCPMAVAIQQNRQVRGAEALAERPDGTQVPFAPYPTPLRDADGKLIGAVNMLVDISESRGSAAARHRRSYARLWRKEAERRASNLLMAILPIAGMMPEEDKAVPRRPPYGRARALALQLMDESALSAGPTCSRQSDLALGPTASSADSRLSDA